MTRTRSLRPSRAFAGAIGALALTGLLATAGCGSGQLSQTANQQAAVNGANSQVGDVLVRDARIVYPQQAAAPDALYARGGSAPIAFTLINRASVADRLVRVSSPIAASGAVEGDATLPQNIAMIAGAPAGSTLPAGARQVTVALTGLTQPVRAGVTVPVTFTFERAGSFTAQVPVDGPGESGEPERVDSEAASESAPASAEPAQPQTAQPQTAQPQPGQPQPAAPGGGN